MNNETIHLVKGYLGYDVMCQYRWRGFNYKNHTGVSIDYLDKILFYEDPNIVIDYIMPILRPLDDLTPLEVEELFILYYPHNGLKQEKDKNHIVSRIKKQYKQGYLPICISDYLNSIHIDYQDLIGKGLAIKG